MYPLFIPIYVIFYLKSRSSFKIISTDIISRGNEMYKYYCNHSVTIKPNHGFYVTISLLWQRGAIFFYFVFFYMICNIILIYMHDSLVKSRKVQTYLVHDANTNHASPLLHLPYPEYFIFF